MEIIDLLFLLGPLLIVIFSIRSIIKDDFFDNFSGLDFSQTLVLGVNLLGDYRSYSRKFDEFIENLNEYEKRFASIIISKQSSDKWMFKNRKLIIKRINEIKGCYENNGENNV